MSASLESLAIAGLSSFQRLTQPAWTRRVGSVVDPFVVLR
jgi:uncharacterized glyoxalase superfamily protein PhnB